jgi:drug/metabolite transporter (DMT)-like permease
VGRRDGQRLTRRHLIGLLIGFDGIIVLVWPEIGLGESPGFLGGALATQLGCAFSPASTFRCLAAGLCLWLPAMARGEWSDLRVSQCSAAAAL